MLFLKYFDEYLNESKNEDRYGCLMLFFDTTNWSKLTSIIDKKDLINSGIEHESHVTVLYGFKDSVNYKEIFDFIKMYPTFTFELDSISIFENETFDVVKFDIKNDLLNSLHYKLRQKFDVEIKYPEYTPHATLAYVKPGTGKKYVSKLKNTFRVISSTFVYSDKNKNKYKLEIN